MGLKSGSRDSGLDESEQEADGKGTSEQERSVEEEERTPEATRPAEGEGTTLPSAESSDDGTETIESGTGSDRPTIESIPYKLRRDKVNEGRQQVPYFLREEVIDSEDDLQATLEELLGENVYKSDYREAAMVVAQRHPELIAEVLREWGYDLDGI